MTMTTASQLIEWTAEGAFSWSQLTYDPATLDGIVTAAVTWPDGSTGTLTTTAFDIVAHEAARSER